MYVTPVSSYVLKVRLQALLVAAGGTRPFNGSTGPERTLSASDRIARIQEVLKGVGLNAEGALPSLAKATAIGEKRALAKEMKVRPPPLQSLLS